MNKLKRILTVIARNWTWKLASFALAFIVWFLVTNMDNPVTVRRFYNIPVTFRNTQVVTDAGQVFEVLDDSGMVGTVTVSARREVADTLTKDNIVAVADFNNLTSRNTVDIVFGVNRGSSSITSIGGSNNTLKLRIEEKKTKTLELSAQAVGTLSKGYVVGSAVTAQNLIRISGPASRVDQVQKAVAEVDVTGQTTDAETQADIKLLNERGKVVTDPSITQNIAAVNVHVTILQTKTVPITLETSGQPADGYLLSGSPVVDPEEVEIAGKSATLSSIKEISLKGEEFSISGRKESLQLTVDLNPYLPDGVVFADDAFKGRVSVTEPIEKEGMKTVVIPFDQIAITNVPEAYTVHGEKPSIGSSPSDGVSVVLKGKSSDLESLSVTQISASADGAQAVTRANLSGDDVQARVSVPLSLSLPEGITQEGTAALTLIVAKK